MKAFDLKQNLSDAELNRLIRRLAVVLVIGAIAFAAFYTIDRWRPAAPAIVDQQLASLEAQVRAHPNDISVRGQLADTYLAKGRLADALSQYDQIIASGASLKPAHLGRAQALVGLGRLDEAATDYQAVVDIAKGGEMANVDPSLASAYYGLGSIAMKQKRAADAVGFLEAAVAISRSDADTIYLLGTAYAANGQLDKAITEFRAAIAFVPVGWGDPYVALADAYGKAGKADLAAWASAMADLTAGRVDVARPKLEALVNGDAGVDAAIGLGVLYESGGDTATAATWYSKALALDPTNSAARLGMSRVAPIPTGPPSMPPSAAPQGGDQ